MHQRHQMVNKIQSKKLEDLELLESIEKIFLKKRGYIFKMPKPGGKVISLMSGGLDTTIVTALLLDTYKLEVYPIHFFRNLPAADPDSVYASVQFFSRFFKKKYGSQFHAPEVFPLEFPIPQIHIAVRKKSREIINKKTGQRLGIPFQPSAFVHNIVNHILSLPKPEQQQIRTIFGGTLTNNIDYFAYESLTSHRALMLEVCTMLRDFSWQITSFPIEKEIGMYIDKVALIKLGAYLHLPLERTFTCQRDYKYHCGNCLVCYVRKEAFVHAGVPDKTIYETDRVDFIGKVKRKFPLLKGILKKM